jgi:hypothetical protein
MESNGKYGSNGTWRVTINMEVAVLRKSNGKNPSNGNMEKLTQIIVAEA